MIGTSSAVPRAPIPQGGRASDRAALAPLGPADACPPPAWARRSSTRSRSKLTTSPPRNTVLVLVTFPLRGPVLFLVVLSSPGIRTSPLASSRSFSQSSLPCLHTVLAAMLAGAPRLVPVEHLVERLLQYKDVRAPALVVQVEPIHL